MCLNSVDLATCGLWEMILRKKKLECVWCHDVYYCHGLMKTIKVFIPFSLVEVVFGETRSSALISRSVSFASSAIRWIMSIFCFRSLSNDAVLALTFEELGRYQKS